MSQYPSWTKPEVQFLESLVGDVPYPELVRRFQRQGQQQGWVTRSEKAIMMRLRRTHQRARCRCGEMTTTGGAAEILGCPATRVEAWLRVRRIREVLQPKWVGKVRYIERRAWLRLARQRPQVFGGFDADRLYALLEDRELADEIAARYPRPLGDWRVRCVETGRIYASCGAAAREHHVTQATVSLAIRQRRPVGVLGLTFEALRNGQPDHNVA